MSFEYTYIDSPVGKLLLAGENEVIHYVSFPSGKMHFQPKPDWQYNPATLSQARQQIAAYFAGQLKQFDLAIAPNGSVFQMQVLDALQQIPFGEMRSYKDIAHAIGRPQSMRAVGAANGRNPIPLIIPCHRVIAKKNNKKSVFSRIIDKNILLKLEV